MELTFDEKNPMGNPWYLNPPPINPTPQAKPMFPPVCLRNFADTTVINKRMYPDIYIEQKRDVREEMMRPCSSKTVMPSPLVMTRHQYISDTAFIPGTAPYEKYSRNVDRESDLKGITRPLAPDASFQHKYKVNQSTSDLYTPKFFPRPESSSATRIIERTTLPVIGSCSCPNNSTCITNPLDERDGFNIATRDNTRRAPYRVYNY